MTRVSQWLVPAVLAASFGAGAMVPVTAHAQTDGTVRVLVDVADVVVRGGQPYDRRGNYGPRDRLVVQRDRYGRPAYYRIVPRQAYYGGGYGYNSGAGYDPFDYRPPSTRVSCSSTGNCTVKYYDRRYDRRGDGRQWDGRRGNDRGHEDDDD
jgi:hypothetical protein